MTFLQLSESNILGAVLAFILGLFIVPAVIVISEKAGLMDMPGGRKIHSHPVSRLGGAAIWLCTIISLFSIILVTRYPHRSQLSGLLLGSSLIFLLGLIDDIYGLSAKFKFTVQLAAASTAFCLGVKISSVFIPFAGIVSLNPFVSYLITIGWITGISNAVNFIDGVDGLAGSVIALSSVTMGFIAVSQGDSVSALIAFILAGSILGFLTYNFYPAKIFMGDSGALFAGFLLAVLSIRYQNLNKSEITMYIPLLVLAAPVCDIVFSSVRRLIKGISPFEADAGHIHHKLLKSGLTQNQAVLAIAAFSALSGALAVLIAAEDTLKYFLYALIISSVMIILNRFAKYERNTG